MTVPEWVQDAIFYQIFPDRFANGDPANDPANVQPWGSPPTVRGFQGGDLAGITQKLDYLSDLGVNALYLNPIFLAASTHRYDTTDYYRIDPKLGDLGDFHRLIAAAHARGMRVILDGVFNHCARGFFAFNDILENGADSPYLNWFHVKALPLRAYEPGKARNYLAWWGIKSLPKLNTDTPAVRRYLLDVARYWIEQGADGWRLDVPNEIDDDAFWAEFRQVVRTVNPSAYLIGEIWETIPRWANDTHFDGLMNYPLRTAIQGYLSGQITTPDFAARVEGLLRAYPRENVYGMYNLIGSHDVERIITYFIGDTRKVMAAAAFQFGFPGAPAIYYGDEIGLPGGKDPDCRRAFPWHAPESWNNDLRAWMQKLTAARSGSAALRRGVYQPLLALDQPKAYAFARVYEGEVVIVALNASDSPAELRFPVGGLGLAEGLALRSLLDSSSAAVTDETITVRLEGFGANYLSSR